jgi:hypothetical protein
MRKRGRLVAWIMLAAWGTWLSGAQAMLVTRGTMGPWVPDLLLLLVVVVAVKLHRRDVIPATFILALCRTATTVDSPSAILAGFGILSVLVVGARRYADANRILVRFAMVGVASLLFASWMALVRSAELSLHAPTSGLGQLLEPLLPGVLVTAVAGAILFQGLILLPGMTPLRQRAHPW